MMENLGRYRQILVAGASGGIGSALLQALPELHPAKPRLLALSRKPPEAIDASCGWISWDPEEPAGLTAQLQRLQFCPDLVIACMGQLHHQGQGPEKQLADFSPQYCSQLMWANCYSHLALAQAVAPLLQRRQPVCWLSLSAKVGSIGDNQLGGWYSYRASKAALNMAMKNLAIEWARRYPLSSVNLVHPGTTDTALSKPFQRNIPAGRLYNRQQTAHRILAIAAKADAAQSGSFYHWDGSILPW